MEKVTVNTKYVRDGLEIEIMVDETEEEVINAIRYLEKELKLVKETNEKGE